MRELKLLCTTRPLVAIALAAGFFIGSIRDAQAGAPPTDYPAVVSGEARVSDGDTLAIGAAKVRLEGMDAPEIGQTCTDARGQPWDCGEAAARALRSLTTGRIVDCSNVGVDKYGRMLGRCVAGGIDLSAEMVRRGLAWAFVRYSKTYVAVEAEARTLKLGIWQGPAMPAWEYRSTRWEAHAAAAPQGCAIKGNVSGHGRIYHMPWSPWYAQVRLDKGRGERWFCSEAEAQAAGWRPAYF
jgi:endonuclease YncB( thermonuclease family)